MGNKDRKSGKAKTAPTRAALDERWWSEDKELESWLEADPATEFEPDDNTYYVPPPPLDAALRRRLEQIKQSHYMLSQFSPPELRVLMDLKRNTSPKAWTLREDLVVLTVALSNREIAELLTDRNKEAVKKRLQLLRSKGLIKRQPPPGTPDPSGM